MKYKYLGLMLPQRMWSEATKIINSYGTWDTQLILLVKILNLESRGELPCTLTDALFYQLLNIVLILNLTENLL